AGVGPQRDDGSDEQVVAAARTADRAVPRRAVVGTDVEQIELGVIRHRVPDRAAAAVLPELAMPRGARLALEHTVGNRAIGASGLSRYRVEAPDLLAGAGIVGRHIATSDVLGAAVADDDFAFDDPRSAGNRVGARGLRGLHRPDLLAVGGIDCDQSAVEGSDIDLTVKERDPAVADITATLDAGASRHCRIEHPDLLSGGGIEGKHLAPGG